MGGTIAVRVAAKGLIPSIVGLVVIDVVEGYIILNCGIRIHTNLLHCYRFSS